MTKLQVARALDILSTVQNNPNDKNIMLTRFDAWLRGDKASLSSQRVQEATNTGPHRAGAAKPPSNVVAKPRGGVSKPAERVDKTGQRKPGDNWSTRRGQKTASDVDPKNAPNGESNCSTQQIAQQIEGHILKRLRLRYKAGGDTGLQRVYASLGKAAQKVEGRGNLTNKEVRALIKYAEVPRQYLSDSTRHQTVTKMEKSTVAAVRDLVLLRVGEAPGKKSKITFDVFARWVKT